MSNTVELEISLIPKIDENAFRSAVNQLKGNFSLPKDSFVIKPQLESKDFMSTFEQKLLGSKNQAKELQGQLALLTLEGKKGSVEYDKIEKELKEATTQASKFENAMGRIAKETQEAGLQSNKAFNFNQTVQSVQLLSNTVTDLSKPFLALDTATANMRTLGDEAAELAPKLREASIVMSKDLPFAASEIQTTMFDALASGVKGGEEGLKTFASTAAKLATGGGSSISEATNLLAGQLNAYGESSEAAAKYSDIFFNTVNFGVTSIGALSTTLANVVPTAASLKIPIENVGAAIATMTSKGIPTAQTTTKLNALFIELAKPGAALAPILKAAGVSLESLAKDSVPLTLEKIKNQLEATNKVGLEVFSSSEAAAAFNVLTGDLKGFAQTYVDVRDTVGSTDFAFEQMTDSIDVQLKSAKAAMEAYLIQGLDLVGGKIVAISNLAGQIAPTFATLANVKSIIPEGASQGLSTFKDSITGVIKSGGGIKGVMGVIGNSFTGLIAPIKAMGAALLTNPIFLIATATIGAIALIKTLSAAMHDTAEEQKQNAVNEGELLEKQKQNSDAKANAILKNRELLNTYDELSKTTNRTAEQEAILTNTKLKLSATYPGMISANKTLSSSLGDASKAAEKAQSDYLNAVSNSQELAKKQLQNSKLQIQLDVGIKKENLENSLTDAITDVSFMDFVKAGNVAISAIFDPKGTKDSMQKFTDIASEFLFGTSIGRKQQENFVKQYSDMVYKAKDSSEITNARIEFANAIGLRNDLTSEQKNTAIKQFDEFAKAQIDGLEKIKKADEDFANNRTGEFNKAYSAIAVNSKDVNKSIAEMARVFGISNAVAREQAISSELQNAAKDGKLTTQEIEGISGKLKLTGNEAAKTGVIIKAAMSDQMKTFAKDGEVSKEEIKQISQQFGLTEKEVKKVVELQTSLNVEAAKTKSLIDGVKGAYKAASEEANKSVDTAKSTTQDFYFKALEAQKNGNKELAKDYFNEYKKAYKQQENAISEAARITQAGQKADVEYNKKIAAETKKINEDANSNLQKLTSENITRTFQLKTEGFSKELSLLKNDTDNQLLSVNNANEEIQKNRRIAESTRLKFQIQYNKQIELITEDSEKKKLSIISTYSDKIIDEERKKNDEKLQKSIDDASKNVETFNTKLLASITSNDFIALTSNANDARLLLLEKQQQKELESFLLSNEIVKSAQREYANAILSGDKNAADNAKKNVDSLLLALKNSDPAVMALIEKQNKDREVLQSENSKKLSDATILSIEGVAQREYALSIEAARRTYAEKIEQAKGNHTLLLQAEIEYNDAKENIDTTYLKKSNTLFAEANSFRISLMENFQNELSKKLKETPETSAQKTALDEQEKQLRESLVKRQITETEFFNKYKEISEKRDAVSNQSLGVLESLQTAFSSSINSSAESIKGNLNNSTKDYAKLLKSQTATDADFLKAKTETFEQSAAVMATGMISFATQSGITMKGFAQQTLDLAYDVLQKNALIIAAEIFGKSVAANPIFGAIAAGGLTAAFYALIAAAKGAIGRKTGEALIPFSGSIDSKPVTKTSDNVLRLLSGGEGVVNADANLSKDKNGVYNYEVVEWSNKHKKPFIEYYNFKDNLHKKITNYSTTNNNLHQYNVQAVETINTKEIVTAINTQTQKIEENTKTLREEMKTLQRISKVRVPNKFVVKGELHSKNGVIVGAINSFVKSTQHLEA